MLSSFYSLTFPILIYLIPRVVNLVWVTLHLTGVIKSPPTHVSVGGPQIMCMHFSTSSNQVFDTLWEGTNVPHLLCWVKVLGSRPRTQNPGFLHQLVSSVFCLPFLLKSFFAGQPWLSLRVKQAHPFPWDIGEISPSFPKNKKKGVG